MLCPRCMLLQSFRSVNMDSQVILLPTIELMTVNNLQQVVTIWKKYLIVLALNTAFLTVAALLYENTQFSNDKDKKLTEIINV